METKKKTGKFFRTFKGQAVIFLLVWSSCNTMTYFIATEDNRKAVRISKDYTESVSYTHLTLPTNREV